MIKGQKSKYKYNISPEEIERRRKRMSGENSPAKRPEVREKMRLAHLGVKLIHTPARQAAYEARKGIPVSESAKKKIREAQLGKHPGWKGDKVSYSGLHKRFVRWYGPASIHPCSVCGKKKPEVKRIEWSNLDGKYTFDRESWEPMCSRCHTLHHRILKLMNK